MFCKAPRPTGHHSLYSLGTLGIFFFVKKYYLFISLFDECVHVCVEGEACMSWCMYESLRTTYGVSSLLPQLGSRDQTQVVELDGFAYLHLLGHHGNPQTFSHCFKGVTHFQYSRLFPLSITPMHSSPAQSAHTCTQPRKHPHLPLCLSLRTTGN